MVQKGSWKVMRLSYRGFVGWGYQRRLEGLYLWSRLSFPPLTAPARTLLDTGILCPHLTLEISKILSKHLLKFSPKIIQRDITIAI